MDFSNLRRDVDCDCVSTLLEPDSADCFVRDFQCADIPRSWFNSYWENGIREREYEKGNARAICLLKGVSLMACPSIEAVIEYRRQRNYSPYIRQKRQYYCIIKFRNGAGRVQPSSTLHCNFYKSDRFNVPRSLEIIDIGDYGDVAP
jgi:hypothetical protein